MSQIVEGGMGKLSRGGTLNELCVKVSEVAIGESKLTFCGIASCLVMLLKYLYTLEILRIKNQLCFKSSIVASLTKPDSASAKYELCAKKKYK